MCVRSKPLPSVELNKVMFIITFQESQQKSKWSSILNCSNPLVGTRKEKILKDQGSIRNPVNPKTIKFLRIYLDIQ